MYDWATFFGEGCMGGGSVGFYESYTPSPRERFQGTSMKGFMAVLDDILATVNTKDTRII